MTASIMLILIIALAALAAVASATRCRTASGLAALAITTVVIALPLWLTCDRFLLKLLPTVWWFDDSEPLAPYFLLYLPLSLLLAVPPAAAVVLVGRRLAPR